MLTALAVAALAAAARFTLLTHQSLWFDEIVSATLAKQHFGAMLHDIARTESTPPLYYVTLWLWTRIFGGSTAALRSLSACVGVLTVLVIYAAARIRFTRRAAVVAAIVAAVHPMLIWYSQEARAYELVTLFVACTLYCFFRARSEPTAPVLAAWALSASAALATHYFAAFIVFPEAALLLYLLRHRIARVAPAIAVPIVVGAALLPLALHQRSTGHTNFIGTLSFTNRVHQTVNQLVFGNYGVSGLHLAAFCLVLVVAVAAAVLLRATPAERSDALLLAGLSIAGFVLPAALTQSAFFYRNLIVVVPSLVLLVGLAAGLRREPSWLALVGVLLAVVLVVPTVKIARDRALQREDWRDAARLVGEPDPGRAILTYPRFEYIALARYRPGVHVVASGTLRIRELVVIGRQQLTSLRLPAVFRRVADERVGTLRLLRLRAGKRQALDVASLDLRPTLRLLAPNGFGKKDGGQDATLLVDR